MQLLIPAAICITSFGWAMKRHFRTVGRPSRFMVLTALFASASTALNLIALVRVPPFLPVPALVLYMFSFALFWSAVSVTRGKLAACGQGRVSTEIVRSGPYRYIRHPFYVSYTMVWLAGFLATAWWPLAVSTVVMALIYGRAAREEERGFLTGPLAKEYRDYLRRTGLNSINTRPGPSGLSAS